MPKGKFARHLKDLLHSNPFALAIRRNRESKLKGRVYAGNVSFKEFNDELKAAKESYEAGGDAAAKDYPAHLNSARRMVKNLIDIELSHNKAAFSKGQIKELQAYKKRGLELTLEETEKLKWLLIEARNRASMKRMEKFRVSP